MEYKNLIGGAITDKISIYNCDCMELLKQTPDNYYSLSLVDPPYGLGIANMNMGVGKSKKSSKIKNRKWKQKDWDVSVPDDEYFNELFRVSQNQIIWGGNYFNLPPCKNFVVWDKEIPAGLSFSDCEFAWTSFSGASKMFRYSAYLNKTEKIHPTQKSPELYKWLLQKYAKQGDKILDTHSGSASLAIACHDFGFELTACELDKDYYDAAIERIKKHVSQLSLFEPEELTQTKQTLF